MGRMEATVEPGLGTRGREWARPGHVVSAVAISLPKNAPASGLP